MTEQDIQSKIIKRMEAQGWYVIKLMQTNRVGMPDLVALKADAVKFIEVKSAKGVLSEVQKYRLGELRSRGFDVSVEGPDGETPI
jgi:Holliday junction resolvase